MFENLYEAGVQSGISYLWAKQGMWLTADNEEKKMEDMGKDYLKNCINMLENQRNSIPTSFEGFLEENGKKYLEKALKKEGYKLTKLSDEKLEGIYNSITETTRKRLREKFKNLMQNLKRELSLLSIESH